MSDLQVHPSEPAEGRDDIEESSGEPANLTSPSTPTAAASGAPEPASREASGRSGPNPLDLGLGVVRVGVGAALVVAPAWAGRIWVGPGADGPGSRVFARALGARDVALGARILRGLQSGQDVRHWVTAGFTADVADVVATMIAARNLTPGRRAVMPLIAAGVAAAALASLKREV